MNTGLPGIDPYSDEHPRGAFNRAMRDKTRQALQLQREQPLDTAVPAPGPAGETAADEMAAAIAAAIERRQHQPTARESIREKTRQAIAVHRATYGG